MLLIFMPFIIRLAMDILKTNYRYDSHVFVPLTIYSQLITYELSIMTCIFIVIQFREKFFFDDLFTFYNKETVFLVKRA